MAIQELIAAIETLPEELADQGAGFSRYYTDFTRLNDDRLNRCAIVHAALQKGALPLDDWYYNPSRMVRYVAEAYGVDEDFVFSVYENDFHGPKTKEGVLEYLKGL
jgi:hypothetical protein